MVDDGLRRDLDERAVALVGFHHQPVALVVGGVAAHLVGLGARTGIELPGEKAGVVPGREWKMQHYNVPWLEGETLNTGIGQGYLNVTPLQLCTVAARIASGNMVSPRMTRVVGHDVQPRPELKRRQPTSPR